MKWVKQDETIKKPIKSWCEDVEIEALAQAINLANHPAVFKQVALMPDCHVGYGMPIGGVIACLDAVIPNAVGVDIGCGMGAIETDFECAKLSEKKDVRVILDYIKERVPHGEGNAHKESQLWQGFGDYLAQLGIEDGVIDYKNSKIPGWLNKQCWQLAAKNLGTLGGGNHFIEMQSDTDGKLWLMLHSGSRNLGYCIASYYHDVAVVNNKKYHASIPTKQLAFLPANSVEGKAYIRDMNFALAYAKENRRLMMQVFKEAILKFLGEVSFLQEINIHHNYASLEHHFGKNVWVHRKGATSAKEGEKGIIPGSMGTASYIVEGLGNSESYMSCSHGAGRKLGRMQACRSLSMEDCDKAMEGVVYDRWNKLSKRGRKDRSKSALWDLSEAPLAYKDIDDVIESELDLIKPVVKLKPIGVVKG